MKIPLNISYKNRLIPNLLISVSTKRKFSSLLVAIDTGCEETILSYKDALILQMPVKDMIVDKKVQGISGDKVGLSEYVKGLDFFFKKQDSSIFKIILNHLYISKDPNGANITLLGTDFLKRNNLKLFYDPNGEAYLEKAD